MFFQISINCSVIDQITLDFVASNVEYANHQHDLCLCSGGFSKIAMCLDDIFEHPVTCLGDTLSNRFPYHFDGLGTVRDFHGYD